VFTDPLLQQGAGVVAMGWGRVHRGDELRGGLICVAVLAGCASIPTTVEHSPLDQAGVPQAIAIIAAPTAPEPEVAAFARGQAGGAVKGAAAGGLAGAWLGLEVAHVAAMIALMASGPFAVVPISGIIVGGAAAGLALGAAAGTSAAIPDEQAKVVESTVRSLVAELRLPELTAHAVAEAAAKYTGYRAEVVADGSGLRERGFGGAIVVEVTRIGFRSQGGTDPPMIQFLMARARLVDAATGKAVALRGLVYVSPPRPASVWFRDGGTLARQGFEAAYRTLAERIVDSLLLHTEVFVGDAALAPTCGVVPIAPKLEWDTVMLTNRGPALATVQSLTPRLAWEGRPAELDLLGSPGRTSVRGEDIRYELRIWNSVGDVPGVIVYAREGLARPEHQVEVALEPASTYYWSVRLRYVIDGRAHATRWSAASVPVFVFPMQVGDDLHYSRMEGETAVPVPCRPAYLTPCGCLDFIPPANLYRFRTP
jgi:hypothetical protein